MLIYPQHFPLAFTSNSSVIPSALPVYWVEIGYAVPLRSQEHTSKKCIRAAYYTQWCIHVVDGATHGRQEGNTLEDTLIRHFGTIHFSNLSHAAMTVVEGCFSTGDEESRKRMGERAIALSSNSNSFRHCSVNIVYRDGEDLVQVCRSLAQGPWNRLTNSPILLTITLFVLLFCRCFFIVLYLSFVYFWNCFGNVNVYFHANKALLNWSKLRKRERERERERERKR